MDDELKDFRVPRPPWVEREHDWLAPFAEIGKALAPIDGQGIVTSVPTTTSSSSLTMADLATAVAKLREHGFPGDRRTIRCGSEEVFRRWAAEHLLLVRGDQLPSGSRAFGLDVLVDADLPPNLIEIRERHRVLSRHILASATEAPRWRAEIEDIGRVWGAP